MATSSSLVVGVQQDTEGVCKDDGEKESVEAGNGIVPMDVETTVVGEEGANLQADASDDDPVVQEYDVYLNRMRDPPFAGDMYVLQYPLRPYYRPYEDQGTLERVELKEKSRRLQFVYKLHENDNYDKNDASAESMKDHVLTSTVVANPACSYAIGTIHNGRMVVAPIHAVNQLRPNFEHMDKKQEERQNRLAKMNAQTGGIDPGAGSGGEEEAQPLQASPVTVNYVAPKKARGGMIESTPVEIQEDWERLDSYTRRQEETQDVHSNYFLWPAADVAGGASRTSNEMLRLQKLSLHADRKAFLGTTCMQGPPRRRESSKPIIKIDPKVLRTYAADKQVEEVVRSVGVCSYSQDLRRWLPNETWRAHAHESLINLLKSCAVLVCGKWIIKSELEGLDGFGCVARDFLLNLVNKRNGKLQSRDIDQWKKTFHLLTDDELRGISGKILDKAPEFYLLKHGVDPTFVESFPRVAEEFGLYWAQLVPVLQNKFAREADKRKGSQKGSGRYDARTHQISVPPSENDEKKKLLIREVELALRQRGMTLSELRRVIQPKFKSFPVEERHIEAILRTKEVKATQLRHLWVVEKTFNDSHDKFRNAIHQFFQLRDSASKEDILETYADVEKSPCALTDFCMRYYLREVADKQSDGTWMLRELL